MPTTELLYLAVSAVAATLLLGVFARVLKFAFRLLLLAVLTVGLYLVLTSPQVKLEIDRALERRALEKPVLEKATPKTVASPQS